MTRVPNTWHDFRWSVAQPGLTIALAALLLAMGGGGVLLSGGIATLMAVTVTEWSLISTMSVVFPLLLGVGLVLIVGLGITILLRGNRINVSPKGILARQGWAGRTVTAPWSADPKFGILPIRISSEPLLNLDTAERGLERWYVLSVPHAAINKCSGRMNIPPKVMRWAPPGRHIVAALLLNKYAPLAETIIEVHQAAGAGMIEGNN